MRTHVNKNLRAGINILNTFLFKFEAQTKKATNNRGRSRRRRKKERKENEKKGKTKVMDGNKTMPIQDLNTSSHTCVSSPQRKYNKVKVLSLPLGVEMLISF